MQDGAVIADRELKLSTRLFYGVGAIAFGLKDTGFSYLLLIFYNQVVGLPAAMVGAAIMIALVADAFFDPIVGQISDNWHSRLGRRHPFMYASAIPAAVTFLLVWIPPKGWSHESLFFYLIVTAILARTSLSFFEIPSTALSAELVNGYESRTRLISMRALFQWYGSLLMTLATFYIFFKTDAAHPAAQLSRSGYVDYGLASCVVIFVVIMASAIGTHDQIPYLRTPKRRSLTLPRLFQEMAETLNNRSFASAIFAGIADSMGYGLSVSLSLYFNTYFWSLNPRQISLFVFSQLISSIIAVMIATPIAQRFGKRNGAILIKIGGLLIGISPILLRLLGVFPANGSPILLPWLVANNLVAVTLASVAAILGSAMIADVVEDSELKTGRRSEGLLFATVFFMGKAVSGVGIFAASMVLLAVGFPDTAHRAVVAPDVLTRLGWTYVPVQFVIVALYVLLISRYSITRRSHAETLTRLAVLKRGVDV
jgi:Na+/melibiose symporter-like transporter